MDKPIFIKLLEYGDEVGLSGTDFDRVLSWASENRIISSTQQSDDQVSLLRDLFFECFTLNSGTTAQIWVLKTEYYFRLLEYRELSEARESSRQANRNAICAIVIAVIGMLFSIAIGYQQLTGQVSIDERQILSINKNIENQSLQIGKTLKEGFLEIANKMKSQASDEKKIQILSPAKNADNPNKTNTADTKNCAAD